MADLADELKCAGVSTEKHETGKYAELSDESKNKILHTLQILRKVRHNHQWRSLTAADWDIHPLVPFADSAAGRRRPRPVSVSF